MQGSLSERFLGRACDPAWLDGSVDKRAAFLLVPSNCR